MLKSLTTSAVSIHFFFIIIFYYSFCKLYQHLKVMPTRASKHMPVYITSISTSWLCYVSFNICNLFVIIVGVVNDLISLLCVIGHYGVAGQKGTERRSRGIYVS